MIYFPNTTDKWLCDAVQNESRGERPLLPLICKSHAFSRHFRFSRGKWEVHVKDDEGSRRKRRNDKWERKRTDNVWTCRSHQQFSLTACVSIQFRKNQEQWRSAKWSGVRSRLETLNSAFNTPAGDTWTCPTRPVYSQNNCLSPREGGNLGAEWLFLLCCVVLCYYLITNDDI